MATNVNAVAVHARCRANPFYRAAVEAACPEYTQAAQLRRELLQAQTVLPGVPAVAPLGPGDNVGAWLDAVVETTEATRIREVQSNALRGELNRCDLIVEAATVSGTDEILAALHDSLMEVMDRVSAAVVKLKGAVSPAQAIDFGTGPAWKALTPLAARYAEIRTAQEWALGPEFIAAHHYSDELVSDLTVSNLDELWVDRDRHTISFGGVPQQDPRPWPSDETERLIWLATSGANPWIPTTQQLNRLNKERAAQRNAAPDDRDSIAPPKLAVY
jgi:hypothetical protein